MIYPFKFRLHGGTLSGKFVFNLEEGSELYLDTTFQPFTKDSEHVRFFLTIQKGVTLITFLRPGFSWNGKPAPTTPVELHAGHTLGLAGSMVEILECPAIHAQPKPVEKRTPKPLPATTNLSNDNQVQRDSDITKTLDVAAFKGQIPKTVFETPTPVKSRAPMAQFALTFALGLACGLALNPPEFFSKFANMNSQPVVDAKPVVESKPVEAPAQTPVVAQVEPLPAAAPVPEQPVAAAPAVEENRAPASVAAPTATPEQRSALISAIKANKLKEVQKLMEQDALAKDSSLVDDEGRSPFISAAAYGHVSMVKFFLSSKADINSVDNNGITALMWAVKNAREKTAVALLDAGADANVKSNDGNDALSFAKKANNPHLESLLKAKAR